MKYSAILCTGQQNVFQAGCFFEVGIYSGGATQKRLYLQFTQASCRDGSQTGGWLGGYFLKTSSVTQTPELASGVPDTPSFSSTLR